VSLTIRSISRWLLAISTLFWVMACDSIDNVPEVDLSERLSDDEVRQLSPELHHKNSYHFSFDLRNSPLEDVRQYLPLLNYLHKSTGYDFDIRLITDIDILKVELQQNKIDFLATGGMNYINIAEQFAIEPLVRGVNQKGKSLYRAVIVVAFNSPIQNLQQLKAKRFAFGAKHSTLGYLIPRIMLLKQGIDLDQLDSYIYTGSHRNCAEAVISHKVDACGMQDTLAQALAEQGQLRILTTSKSYPSSGISATSNVPQEVKERVRQALIDFEPESKDKSGLHNWQKTEMPLGFVKASPTDYDELKTMMLRLNLLPSRNSNFVPAMQDKK